MKTAKTYDTIKELLSDHPELRDSDNRLIFEASTEFKNAVNYGTRKQIKEAFMNLKFETIRRNRQKVQENNPELQASKRIKKFRQEKEQNWTSIFKEQMTLI